jgi:glycosyltransferase involved in cell wall biosynthesis
MKVLFICPAFPPKICGVGNYTASLIRAMAEKGTEISLLTERGSENTKEYGLARLYTLGSWRMSEKRTIKRHLLSECPDIVHIQYQQALFHPGWLGLSLPAYVKKWLPRAKVVVTQHDLNYPYLFKGAGRLGLRTPAILKKMWKHADAVIIGYQAGKDQIEKLFPPVRGKVHLIPVGPGMEFKDQVVKDKHVVCQKYGLNPKLPLLVSFGFIYRDKDFPLVFKALRKLKDRRLELNFIHVGGQGEEKSYLPELNELSRKLSLSGQIAFAGTLEPAEAARTLGSGDIGLLIFTEDKDLGRHSTLPLMLQTRLPLVVTSRKSSGGNESAWLPVPAGDIGQLIQSIEAILQDSARAQKMAAAACELYKNVYSPKVIGEKTIEIYRKLSDK